MAEARSELRFFLLAHGLSASVIDDVLIALTEAAGNAARHSRASEAQVTARISDETLELLVNDAGCGFPASEIDLSRPPSLSACCGRGLYLISCVMDSLEICCEGGTTLRMTKRLTPLSDTLG